MQAMVLGAVMLGLALGGCSSEATVPSWDPGAFSGLRTLQFLTVGPEEGPHWSTVWLVVLDGGVYVRLGTRAADRMQRNTTAPYVGVRIGGREYPRVHVHSQPAMAERVAAAMADKYGFDLIVRHFEHPLTMRLTPEPVAGGS
jgi:hypothetical protein